MSDLILPIDVNNAPSEVEDFFSLEHKVYPYDSYVIGVEYRTAEGLIQLPIAVDEETLTLGDPTSIVVRAHAGITQKIVSWVVQRVGLKPNLPKPTPPDSNHVLLSTNITSEGVALDTDGLTHIYTLQGNWVFALLTPKRPGIDNLTTATPPTIATDLDLLDIKAASFKTGMF